MLKSHAATKMPPGASERAKSGTESILLVDDDDLVRELGQEILALNENSVLTVNNSREALHLCADRKGPIDLLITDVRMPGNDTGISRLIS